MSETNRGRRVGVKIFGMDCGVTLTDGPHGPALDIMCPDAGSPVARDLDLLAAIITSMMREAKDANA